MRSMRACPIRCGKLFLAALAAVVPAVPVGCRDAHGTPELAAASTSPDANVLPRAAPRAPAPEKPVKVARTVRVGDIARRYLLVTPLHLDAARAYPLVLYFHGDGGDGEGMDRAAPFEAASGSSALVAYPDGVGQTWDLETTTNNRDVAFAAALVADVARDFTLDPAEVYAFGYSSGAFFSNVLACQRPGMLRAIASNAGGAPYHELEKWPNGFPKCPGQRPVATIALHGESDLGVTLDSGRFTAEYWAYVDGCRAGDMDPTGYPECRAYRGCRAGTDVVFCRVPGLGHWVWDRAPEVAFAFFRREGMSP